MTSTTAGDYELTTLRRMAEERSPEEILAERDLVLRNYLITLRYHLLTHRMRAHIPQELSWVAFATWASAQAGRYIRLEALPLPRNGPLGAGAYITEQVSLGNYIIFEEIASLFDRFAAWVEGAEPEERAAWEALVRAGDHQAVRAILTEVLSLDPAPMDPATGQGQRLLLLAFEQYLFAMYDDDADQRAERVFAANGAIGLHEQFRVQEVLERLLAPRSIQAPLYALMTPARGLRRWTRPARHAVGRKLAPHVEAGLGPDRMEALMTQVTMARLYADHVLGGTVSEIVGTLLLRLSLPDEELRLSRDVPWKRPKGKMFPDYLATIDTVDPELRALFDELFRWDRSPDDVRGSATLSWARLDERVNFLLDLFRTRQTKWILLSDPIEDERRRRRRA
ncbi:MAG: hypothetical protein KF901_11410 [Myxococcales bacterium]|nr:hypothetical protein [Myxococcales bacterium]